MSRNVCLTGLEAWVTVDDKPVEIYGIGGKDSKAFGYIESQEGKEFKVVWVDKRMRGEDHNVRVFIDGIK
ncbi:hypothetical protein JCM11251_000239 [Rhodosporidiobolus azoricus]